MIDNGAFDDRQELGLHGAAAPDCALLETADNPIRNLTQGKCLAHLGNVQSFCLHAKHSERMGCAQRSALRFPLHVRLVLAGETSLATPLSSSYLGYPA